jgi:hypothetical protein
LENNAANASRAVEAFSLRFFNHSAVVSKGDRTALFDFLPRGFLALRVCRICSCSGESFLINFAFITLPSNCLYPNERKFKGSLAEAEKIIIRRISMRPGINSTQKLLTLDFPNFAIAEKFCKLHTGGKPSQAGEDSRRYRE